MSMQPMFTIQSSASSSLTSAKSIRRRFGGLSRVEASNCRVGIQSGMCLGASFWKKNLPFQPSGYRFIVNGRSFRCGTSTGAMSR